MVEKDEVWEHYGEENPYYGVFTIDKFKDENLNEAAKDEFFQSGEAHIERIWNEIEDAFIRDFKPKERWISVAESGVWFCRSRQDARRSSALIFRQKCSKKQTKTARSAALKMQILL